MNNEPRNFYLEEEKYENAIIEVKKLIKKINNINIEQINEKIKIIDIEKKYLDFIDVFNAVIGKSTTKFYYCDGLEDAKYYGLKEGFIYNAEKIHPDLQKSIGDGKRLNLQVRAMLAEKMIIDVKELIEMFKTNVVTKEENSFDYSNFNQINELDIDSFKVIYQYLETIINKAGRLKILVAEKELEKQETKNKQSFFDKIIFKLVNKDK